MSDIPNPFQLSLTKVADMFTTVAIKSQPAYIPNDKGIIKCPLDFTDNNFSNINDSENKKATIKITDNSNCR